MGRTGRFGADDGLTAGPGQVAVTADGTVWAAEASGLARFDETRWTTVGEGSSWGPLAAAPDGSVFVVGPSGLARVAAADR